MIWLFADQDLRREVVFAECGFVKWPVMMAPRRCHQGLSFFLYTLPSVLISFS
jgi:hypothetical protein